MFLCYQQKYHPLGLKEFGVQGQSGQRLSCHSVRVGKLAMLMEPVDEAVKEAPYTWVTGCLKVVLYVHCCSTVTGNSVSVNVPVLLCGKHLSSPYQTGRIIPKRFSRKWTHGSFYWILFKTMRSFKTKEKNTHYLWQEAMNCYRRVMWERIQDVYWAGCIETRFFPICCLATMTFVLATTWSHWAI